LEATEGKEEGQHGGRRGGEGGRGWMERRKLMAELEKVATGKKMVSSRLGGSSFD